MKKLFSIGLLILGFVCQGFAHQTVKRLPSEVHFVAEKAEDVIDYYLKNDWTTASTIVDSISLAESAVVKNIRENKMPVSSEELFGYLIFQIQTLTRKKTEPIQAALTANQITALLIDLQIYYAHKAPIEVARMDYLGREIVLLAQVQYETSLLNMRISEVKQTWKWLKPTIIKKNGTNVAQKIDDVLSNLKSDSTVAQKIKAGNRILDLVDELEGLFK